MQRCRAGFLCADQNEIEPVDLSQPTLPHRHESRTTNRIAQSSSLSRKSACTNIADLFCNFAVLIIVAQQTGEQIEIQFPVLQNDGPCLKVFARGTLTFLEIIIVVTFVASLATIAAISSLGCASGTGHPEVPNVLCFTNSATDRTRLNRGVPQQELSHTCQRFMLVDVHWLLDFAKSKTNRCRVLHGIRRVRRC
jgi:hypothetical protein